MVKIIEKINAKIEKGELFYSFEYFPPKTDEGVQNLVERQHRMFSLGPTFCDITWGAGGSTADLTLDIAKRMQNEVREIATKDAFFGYVWCSLDCQEKEGLTVAGWNGDDDAPNMYQHAGREAQRGAGQGASLPAGVLLVC